jgi:hypothetical protein
MTRKQGDTSVLKIQYYDPLQTVLHLLLWFYRNGHGTGSRHKSFEEYIVDQLGISVLYHAPIGNSSIGVALQKFYSPSGVYVLVDTPRPRLLSRVGVHTQKKEEDKPCP